MSAAPDLTPPDAPRALPVTGVQRALIVSSLIAPPGTDQLHVTIRTPRLLTAGPLDAAWHRLLTRHPLLAAIAYVEDTEVRLLPGDPAAARITVHHTDIGSARAVADELLIRSRARRLVLGEPLARLACVVAKGWGSELLLVCHHAVADGRSLVTILDELLGAYDALASGRRPALAPAPDWSDFAAALAARQPATDYWRAHLAGSQPRAAFAQPDAEGAQLDPSGLITMLSLRDTEALAEVAARRRVSFATLVQTAWALVLAARTRGDEVLFGVTLGTRYGSIRDADDLVGPGINTAPVCLRLPADEPVATLLARVRATLRGHRDRLVAPLGETLARADASDLLPLVDSIVMVDRANIEHRLHRARPRWREASVTIHRHLPVPVGLWAFEESSARVELTVDRRRMTSTAAAGLLATTVDALQLLAEDQPLTIGRAIARLARTTASLTAVPSLGELPPVTRADRAAFLVADESPRPAGGPPEPRLVAPAAALESRAESTNPPVPAAAQASPPTETPAGATGLPVAADELDVAAPSATGSGEMPAHLVALGTDWGLWRDLIVRSTAVEFDALDALADPQLSALADAAAADPIGGDFQAAVARELPAAGRRLNSALHRVGRDPRVREAIAWQNRRALATGVDSLLRRDPATVRRNTKHRQHEALLGSYLQRYAAKNDTIGFFGPLAWGRLVDGDQVLTRCAASPLAARTTYLEGWALTAVMAPWNDALRPDLAPTRRPHIGLDEHGVRIPNASPIPLAPGERAALAACDGSRPARVIAAEIAGSGIGFADAGEVMAALHRARERGWIAWELHVHPEDAHGEDTLRSQLLALPASSAVRGALEALDRLVAARDILAQAAGDADAVAAAGAALDRTFSELSGTGATRRAGELYAGRTVAYEDARLGTEVTIGTGLLTNASEALQAVLLGARWYATAAGRLLDHLVRCYHAERAPGANAPLPLGDVWALIVDVVAEESDELIGPVARGLAERWTRVLQLPVGDPAPPGPGSTRAREIRLDGRAVLGRAQAEFAIDPGGWQGARQHGPDVMLLAAADGRPRGWVLGEIHPGVNCLRYRTWVEHHDDPPSLRRAMLADVGEPAIWQAATGAQRGMPTRLTNALTGADDLWLACASDALGPDWEHTLRLGDLDLLPGPEAMWLVDRRTNRRLRLLDAIADLLTGSIVQGYRVIPKTTAYSPRVWIDDLVVARERWSFPVTELGFAAERDEARRFVAARAWAWGQGMPRRLFMTTTGEKKPVYLDRDSLLSTDLLCRAVRRAAGLGRADASLTLTEMLPGPDDLWLRDAAGHRHTAELRLVATDRVGGGGMSARLRQPAATGDVRPQHALTGSGGGAA